MRRARFARFSGRPVFEPAKIKPSVVDPFLSTASHFCEIGTSGMGALLAVVLVRSSICVFQTLREIFNSVSDRSSQRIPRNSDLRKTATGAEESIFETGAENHIFEYERALDLLMTCALRCKTASNQE